MNKSIEIFFSYAHEDEPLRDELAKHLKLLERQGIIQSWHDRKITAGEEWKSEIDTHLESAEIILLLISADFLASDYCYNIEMKRSLERHKNNQARVIPVILRPVDWHRSPFGKLVALPTDEKPITTWPNQDEAFTDVAQGLRRAIDQLKGKHIDSTPASEKASMTPEPDEKPSKMSQSNSGNSTGVQISVSGGTVNISPPPLPLNPFINMLQDLSRRGRVIFLDCTHKFSELQLFSERRIAIFMLSSIPC
jgi:hypothetical protein